MREHDSGPSTTSIVVLAVFVFVAAALAGATAHLTWLMIRNSALLATAGLAGLFALLYYILRSSRRSRRVLARRPLEELLREFEAGRETPDEDPRAAPDSSSGTARAARGEEDEVSGSAAPESAPGPAAPAPPPPEERP